jgi:triacylglycerol lipase
MNPILFIHGFGGYIEQYQPIIKFLKKKGFENFYEFEYKNKFGFDSIKVITKELADFIEKNIKEEKIDIIAFSQGGIIALEYLKDFLSRQASKNIEVEKLFTLCTPYKGSKLAKIANLPGIVELRPNSQLLNELEKFIKESKINIYSVYTPFDLMVFPGWNARASIGKKKIVFAPTHPATFAWSAVIKFIYKELIAFDKPINFKNR